MRLPLPVLSRVLILAIGLSLAGAVSLFSPTPAQAQQNVGSLPEIDFYKLSDRNFGVLGQAAMQIRPREWKHSETEHFIYHYFQSFVATPVSVEAEFYYKIIAQELGKNTSQWERKCHIFVFEQADDWAQFQSRGSLDPWTGGLHAGGDLFIFRDASAKWKGNTLGHEVAHLIVHRFFGPGIPLWLNEGFAENSSLRGWAAFFRARGYAARPKSQAIAPQAFLPLAILCEARSYPTNDDQVAVFYNESERLVRFLSTIDKKGFQTFFDAMSKGARTESALQKGFGSRFANLEALEKEFRDYATKDHGTPPQN